MMASSGEALCGSTPAGLLARMLETEAVMTVNMLHDLYMEIDQLKRESPRGREDA